MIRTIILWNTPGWNDLPAWERYYARYHAPEIMARFGPWITRFVGYRVVPAPPDAAEPYGYYNYRVTEIWWRELPGPPDGALSFTPIKGATGPPQGASCNLPSQATEDFMGSEITPDEKTVLRWLIMFKYPDGVSPDDGEDWYLNVHVKEVMQQPGLTRFFSTRTIPMQGPLPGWRALATPQPAPPAWFRVSEQWYENFAGWRKSVIEKPPKYTRPPWAKYEKYPFLQPYTDLVTTFLLEQPTQDWLKDFNPYV